MNYMDPLPWAENELQDMLLDQLKRRHANHAAAVVEDGYLVFTRWEQSTLGDHLKLHIRIKVAPNKHPSAMDGRSFWGNNKISHGEEVEQRTKAALLEVTAGVEHVKIESFGFESSSPSELERLHSHRMSLVDRHATNQGNVHPVNPATKIGHDGLRYRSYHECLVSKALKDNIRNEECYSPLAVIVGEKRRIEPDLLLFTKKQNALIEIDDASHQENVDDARKRTAALEMCGFQVWRVHARDVDTPAKADAWVRDLLSRLHSGASRVDA